MTLKIFVISSGKNRDEQAKNVAGGEGNVNYN